MAGSTGGCGEWQGSWFTSLDGSWPAFGQSGTESVEKGEPELCYS